MFVIVKTLYGCRYFWNENGIKGQWEGLIDNATTYTLAEANAMINDVLPRKHAPNYSYIKAPQRA